MIDVQPILAAIRHPQIKVISFDIFDTLLERPAVYPTDIFILMNRKAARITGRHRFDFHQIRSRAERLMQRSQGGRPPSREDATFEQIYAFIARKHRLTEAQKNTLAKEEMALESALLKRREAGAVLYRAAVDSGKRIICLSDMYHDRPTLAGWLNDKGYARIDHVYVSSEIKKRKDSGALYDHVLQSEHLRPHELLHIGDNRRSDVEIPLEKGIVSFHLPGSLECLRHPNRTYGRLWPRADRLAPADRLLIGFYAARRASTLAESDEWFPTRHEFGYFGLGLPLAGAALHLLSNPAIQHNYSTIHFASRDGYLPRKAYDVLRRGRHLPSHYLYCGRSLYAIADYRGNAKHYLLRRIHETPFDRSFTVGMLFDSMVRPGFLEPGDPRRHLVVATNKVGATAAVREILAERSQEISAILSEKRAEAEAYYSTVINAEPERRSIVFDCGYSGSVAEHICRLAARQVDKAYIWVNPRANRRKDRLYSTTTFVIGGSVTHTPFPGFWLLLEELFSPLQPSCIGMKFSNNRFQPVFDPTEVFPEDMRCDLEAIQEGALAFVSDLADWLGEYSSEWPIRHFDFTLQPLALSLRSKTDRAIRHLEHIRFPDSFHGNNHALSEKIERGTIQHLLRTDFVDHRSVVSTPEPPPSATRLKLAIHLHWFHPDQAPLFIRRLAKSAHPFDLLLTVCSEESERMAPVFFNKDSLPAMGNLVVKRVPNRGRDVAPWLVGLREEQRRYDLVGHLHTKQSAHFSFGDAWRDYLLDNLIEAEALDGIVKHFEAEASLGLMFPPIFDDLLLFMSRNHISPLGHEGEQDLCNRLLQEMGCPLRLTRHRVHFSAGTMFWYRPAALAPMLSTRLSFEDFPEEPIGVGGSLAHAFERMPSIVAQFTGYSTRCYIRQSEIIRNYMEAKVTPITEPAPRTGPAWRCWELANVYFQKLFPTGSRSHRWIKTSLLAIAFQIRRIFSRRRTGRS